MISAVVLTHNDAQRIERTLKSLVWCDEIIVIDDNSNDDTLKRAKTLGASCYPHSLQNNFAAQRNYGLEKVKGDWAFFVDSDEVVSTDLANEIQTAIKETSVVGYMMARQDSLFGTSLKHGETAQVRLLRLAKKTAGKWERAVHEIWQVSGEIGTLRHPLMHFPHQSITEFLNEINRYSTVNALQMRNEGKTVSWFEIVAYPTGKFLQNYFLREGYRDGMPGAIIAFMMSFHSFLTRGKLWRLQS